MKKTFLAVATTLATLAAAAQPAATDTVPSVALSEVEVLGTRASENTPVAFTSVNSKQFSQFVHFAQHKKMQPLFVAASMIRI